MKKNIVIIDNYDSFTYNLVHAVEEITGDKVDVYRNDKITAKACDAYEYIIISPGPGLPEESGNTLDIIHTHLKSKKIFGVCLGLQSLVVSLGGQLKNLERVLHGIESDMMVIEQSPIYKDIPSPFKAGRYHSWVADRSNFPKSLIIDCQDADGEIMGIRHKDYPVYAVQFHPESIMTPAGNTMIKNFINL